MLEINKIHQGDCFKLMDEIEDGSVDLVLTDPPYNISVKNSKEAYGNGRVGMDFGDWDYGFDTEKWIRQLATKPNEDKGQMLIFNSYHNFEIIARVLEEHGYNVRLDPIYWIKTNPVPHFPHRMPVSSFEHVLWATRGDEFVYNPTAGFKHVHGRYEASSHEEQGQRFHTTQKPMSLWNKILKTHSNPGDLVLDTFGGSCVTAASSVRLRRNFIVMEMDDGYYKKGLERLNRERGRSKTLWW